MQPSSKSVLSVLTRRGVALVALAGFALALVGCSSPGREARRAPHPQPVLVADATFYGESLAARVTLKPFVPPMGGGPGEARRPGGGERRRGRPIGGTPDELPPSFGAHGRVPAALLTGPRVVLNVAFTNRGEQSAEFAVTDVVSELGNFAVRPERLVLAPGQTAELDPMNSSFPGVISALSVELRVRRAGETQVQTVQLRPESPAPSAVAR